MTRQLIVRETRWYIAFQDGPAENRDYATREDAEAALASWSEIGRQGAHVTSRVVDRPVGIEDLCELEPTEVRDNVVEEPRGFVRWDCPHCRGMDPECPNRPDPSRVDLRGLWT